MTTKMDRLLPALLLILSLALTKAVVIDGDCAEFKDYAEFKVPPYLGRWYEVKRFEAIFELGSTCVTADYGYLTDTSITVTNSALDAQGELFNVTGVGYATDTPGELIVIFDKEESNLHQTRENSGAYNVLATDYEGYSCVYSCYQLGEQKDEYAWILSRTPVLEDTLMTVAEDAFTRWNISVDLFYDTYQGDDCIYSDPPEVY